MHSQLRLAVVSLLISVDEADFSYIRKTSGATSGNLSVQISKLKEAGYIAVEKSFKDNFPLTTCRITEKGKEAFLRYVDALEDYIQVRNKNK
ncbi:MAG TPA: transcriptional regulator [Cyclobacteriaceae bacterium]|nr:transcriptional regulator [Cyclobacteriaceae bacterium]